MTKKATLYSTKTCAHCQTAKSLLTLAGYEVEYLVLGENVTHEEFQRKFPNERIVPQVMVGDKHLSGINAVKKFINTGE